MKIVVKHVDNLKSSLIKSKVTPQYLVYQMTEDNVTINCDIVNGDIEKNKVINKLQSNVGFTLPVYEVTYDEFKNNVLRNETNYVGN